MLNLAVRIRKRLRKRGGYSSMQTTERYFGVEQNLHSAPCDALIHLLASFGAKILQFLLQLFLQR
jgi:hypothetical protein